LVQQQVGGLEAVVVDQPVVPVDFDSEVAVEELVVGPEEQRVLEVQRSGLVV
jgi:hypothetical protein